MQSEAIGSAEKIWKKRSKGDYKLARNRDFGGLLGVKN